MEWLQIQGWQHAVFGRSMKVDFYRIESDNVFLIVCLIRFLISMESETDSSRSYRGRSSDRTAFLNINN
jgi:hypothetical protein